MGTSSGGYELNHECANTTVPLQYVTLVFWKAYVDMMSSGRLFLGIPVNFLPDVY